MTRGDWVDRYMNRAYNTPFFRRSFSFARGRRGQSEAEQEIITRMCCAGNEFGVFKGASLGSVGGLTEDRGILRGEIDLGF